MERNAKTPIEERLWIPHYSDPKFKEPGGLGRKEVTIYLSRGSTLTMNREILAEVVEGARYEYSDHLFQDYDEKTLTHAYKKSLGCGHAPRSANFIEAYLRELLNIPNLSLVHIVSGVGTDGYPYRAYGYVLKEAETAK